MYEPERSLQNNLFFWSSANFLDCFQIQCPKRKVSTKKPAPYTHCSKTHVHVIRRMS